MADKHGPFFRIKLGPQQTFVVTNSEIAKECLTTNDKVLATRPKSLASQIIGYNYTILAVAPYGAYLRKIRRILLKELMSSSRIKWLRPIKESHIRKSIKRTFAANYCVDQEYKNKGALTVEMKQWFGRLIMNLTISLIFGEQKVEEGEESKVQESIRRMLELFAEPVVADFLPWLRWLDIGGHEKAMRQTAMEMDSFAQRSIEEHRRKRNNPNFNGKDEDFMDIVLSLFDGASKPSLPNGYDIDVVIKSTCLSVLIGAAETSIVTLTWALCLILNNYSVLERIQDELNTHVGKQRCIEESDLNQLIYLQAVIKETLRLYPPAPLLVPHEAMEDCTVNGYNIQKGTRILVNIAKIHRDPMVWAEPDKFKPDRYLTSHKDIDVRGNNFELIPFSSGRRICPGISLGLQTMQLTLASLFHSFDTRRLSNEPIDMTESSGVTNVKATPLQALLIPRLASNLYG
ncbi:cytochrome P450 82A4-like isoform X2 [Ipomoea triloba]|uniref:cytochrome P450 82A4-like isoform X2 n=1 Tax=Ipomoea triloba TaxID=35885 RepID=UPI00125D12ED|nr:cytochrome P450 82A4-like isoform X2 [Ipomoea triloba]